MRYASAHRALCGLAGNEEISDYIRRLDEEKLREDAKRALDTEHNELFGGLNRYVIDESIFKTALSFSIGRPAH